MIMEPRISLVTLGVSDLVRARRFYIDGLGWQPAMETADVVFFQLGGLAFGLWSAEALAADMHLPGGAAGPPRFSLAYNVRERDEVDSVLGEAQRVGARLLKAAEDAPWGGRSGYFADPDGHAWEVAWNPGWTIEPDGSIRLRP
jgi:catechol 2,3-dioxygenase-like lactoylglutathione lyase family enzyme